jgi:hypothetical protein
MPFAEDRGEDRNDGTTSVRSGGCFKPGAKRRVALHGAVEHELHPRLRLARCAKVDEECRTGALAELRRRYSARNRLQVKEHASVRARHESAGAE